MEKIKIIQGKRLKLQNVLIKSLQNVTLEEYDNEIRKFINFLEVSNIETKGPLITNLLGSVISDDGDLTFNYKIMIQLVRKLDVKGFSFKKYITVDNCLYVKYQGLQEEFSYVQSKLDLFIWENNLIDKGQEFSVHIDSDGLSMHVDVFRPMEQFNETL